MKLIKRTKKGFTIVELVIVIAVIAVLAAVLIPTFINLTNKANKAADDSLVTSLNKALAIEEVDHDVDNMHDAVECLKREGYLASALVTKSDQKLLYNLDKNRFLLEEDRNSEEYQGYPDYSFWIIADSYDPENQQYSVYASDNFSTEEIEDLEVGFDAGDCDDVESVEYIGSTGEQHVVIRTNNGNLEINASSDDVNWFGVAKVNVVSVKGDSFHAFGKPIGEVKIQSGHYVVESRYETNFLIQGAGVNITTKSNDEIIVLKENTVASYTVNGIEYTDSSVVSGKTQTAVIDDTKAIINLNTKTTYDSFNTAMDAVAEGEKLVLLKDVEVIDNSPVPTDSNNNAAVTITDKIFSLNGNGNTITSDGKHSGNYTSHDLFNLVCSGNVHKTITMNIYNVNIEATHYQDVFLVNSDLDYDFILNLSDSTVTCDGESVYSNGPRGIAVLNNCEFTHVGTYAAGKDDRYYSALIVGYGAFINAYNCKVSSFGNGVTTFPSGGVVNLFNTDINIEAVEGTTATGYAIRCTMEPNPYEGLYVIRGAEVSVYGGNVHGDFSLKDTSVTYDAKISVYEGTFDHNPSAYVVDGKTCTQSGNSWIVK